MKRSLLIILLLSFFPSFGQTFTAYRNTVDNGYNFWVSTPKDYDSLQSDKPIILFLHGASLCGHNLDRVRRYGPLDALAMGRQIDAVIIAPQNPGGAWNPLKINNVVNWVFDHYAGDTNRFYVLGMSLGGYGTIDYSAVYHNRIAAAMALCGGGNPKSYCGLNDLPLWILHGTADEIVSFDVARQFAEDNVIEFVAVDGADHRFHDPKKMDAAGTLNALKNVYETVKAGLDAGKNDEELQQDLMDLAQKLGIKNAGVFNPLRTAVTGMAVSPPPFSCIRLLGKEESYRRIERAISVLEKEIENV